MKKNQEEVLVEKIGQELGVSNSERYLAYEIFIKKITAALQYDETIKIPNIGLFQRKKGLFIGSVLVPNSASNDTLIFSPFSNNKDNLDFAYFNIPIKTKSGLDFEFDENIFSLSINKPIILFDKEGINSTNPSTSLIILKKAIEDKINTIITLSDFLEGINLWEDFIPAADFDNSIMGSELTSADDIYEQKDNIFFSSNLNPILTENKQFDELPVENVVDETFNADLSEVFSSDSINLSIQEELLTENNFDSNDSDFEENTDIANNLDQYEDAEVNIEVAQTEDGIDSSVVEDLPKLNNKVEDDIFADLLKDEFNSHDLDDAELELEKSLSNTDDGDNLDWNKELEDELFSSDKENNDEISLDNIIESKEPDEDDFRIDDINPFVNSNNDEQDDNKFDDIDTDTSKNNLKFANEDENNKLLDSNIDDLIDGLSDEKPKTKPDEKTPHKFNKLLIILVIAAVVIGASGAVYYFFFKNTEKTHNKAVNELVSKEKKEEKTKPVEEKKIIDSTNTGKPKDSTIVNEKEKETLQKTDKAEIPAKDTKVKVEPKVETSTTKESINKDKKTILPANNKINNDKNLYKNIAEDKLITEKIYFDGTKYNIQTSSWQSKSRAEVEVFKLRRLGFNAYIVEVNLNKMGTWYRVKIFDFSSKSEAVNFMSKHNL